MQSISVTGGDARDNVGETKAVAVPKVRRWKISLQSNFLLGNTGSFGVLMCATYLNIVSDQANPLSLNSSVLFCQHEGELRKMKEVVFNMP